MSALLAQSLSAARAALAAGTVSSLELTQHALQRIDRFDGKLRAFLRVDAPGALGAAAASDARRAAGQGKGPLEGIPVALKDNILTLGLETTAGSRILEGFIPQTDAWVTHLLREAGAVLLGKTNLDEFGMGSSTEHSAFHPTLNPWSLAHTPGGSSGGSAAAVAARFAFGAYGTDTGGSIRQPASFTNTVGLKPTYGRVSRRGVIAYASSLDQVGAIGRTVEDTALLYAAIAGHDPGDATSSPRAVPALQLRGDLTGKVLGVPHVEGVSDEVAAALEATAAALRAAGATTRPVQLPNLGAALHAYYVIAPCEASSNLSRYDGVRYGHRSAHPRDLRELYEASRAEGFGAEVKRRILLGTFALSAGYYDAYYVKAQRVRTLVKRDFEAALAQVDALLLPTSPGAPFKFGDKAEPLQMYAMDALTVPVSLAGLPAVSVPCAFTREGLPIGAQVVGRAFDEAAVLEVALAIERLAGCVDRAPPEAPWA